MSVKQTQRCWELFRKRLRDVQKRESEFITATRQNLSNDLCEKQTELLKSRIAIYDSHLSGKLRAKNDLKEMPVAQRKLQESEASIKDVLEKFDQFLTNPTQG